MMRFRAYQTNTKNRKIPFSKNWKKYNAGRSVIIIYYHASQNGHKLSEIEILIMAVNEDFTTDKASSGCRK